MNLADSSGWLEYFALSAARLSISHKRPMADSVMLATAAGVTYVRSITHQGPEKVFGDGRMTAA